MRYNQEQLRQLSDEKFKQYYTSYGTFYNGLQPAQKTNEKQYAQIMQTELNSRKAKQCAEAQLATKIDLTEQRPPHNEQKVSRTINLPQQQRQPQMIYSENEEENYAKPAQTNKKGAPLVKSKCLFASALIGGFYAFYSVSYFAAANASQQNNAAAIGAGIATMLVIPHMICAVLATIFNIVGWVNNKRGFALTGAILYAVSAALFPLYALFVLPEIVLSFVGYAKLKTIKKNDIRICKKQKLSYVPVLCLVAASIFGIFLGNSPIDPTETENNQVQSIPANATVSSETTISESDSVKYVTLEMFNSVQTGDTYDAVVSLFGYEGKMTNSMEVAEFGYKSESYSWNGKDGISSAMLTFKDGIVSSKMQIGLE